MLSEGNREQGTGNREREGSVRSWTYSATGKAKGKRQKAKVYYHSFSTCINVLTLIGSAIISDCINTMSKNAICNSFLSHEEGIPLNPP
ncbi:hypothetical protein LYNGBM3L_08140 [Moorena producens 3L]|uniref:Uncharacterized protein n=1 Tax=Moorena producens 3L TaxID=489825 RepID=F4XJP3_9CYAN|nr:hypothetical protein LYNGBM3L_08140 [Moorena producens 3L]